jgi:hypothetical protein
MKIRLSINPLPFRRRFLAISMSTLRHRSALPAAAALAACVLCLVWFATPASGSCNEEFAGPFPSWRNAQRDYGARGDGQADDTAALQRGLDELVKHTNFCVLYLPAGTIALPGR